MPKLHLKTTPAEDNARRLRKKERREERKRRSNDDANSSTTKRRRTETTEEPSRKWASSDEEDFPGYYDTRQAEVGEREFREKMFDETENEDRLDTLEARFNDYAHVPGRWRRGGSTGMGDYAFEMPDVGMASCLDPRYMEDEEYTEWIRTGMYRLKHADEYAEQQRRKTAHKERVLESKKEQERLEQVVKEERKKKKEERWKFARQQYDQRWKVLLSRGAIPSHEGQLKLVDIPWPILNAYKTETICLEDLTVDAIRSFLLPVPTGTEKKEKLREAMLRFHPDKFEGRMMKFVAESERGSVREGIAQVVRVVNKLLSEGQLQ